MSGVEAPALVGQAQPVLLGVDNGATNTRLSLVHGEEIIGGIEYKTPHNYRRAINTLQRESDILLDGRKLAAVGFAIAGKVADGQIVQAGQLEEYGWCFKPFAKDVSKALDVGTESVVLMNDCVAAAKAQQVANRKVNGPTIGFVATISTGFGGAKFIGDTLEGYEPGHIYLPGSTGDPEKITCGCGWVGHIEAHISGSGIERKYGTKAENIPAGDKRWDQIINDTVKAHAYLIERWSKRENFNPEAIYFFGSVALKSPQLLIGLREGLKDFRMQLPAIPEILKATHGDDSGLVGASDGARELAYAA